MIVDSDLWLFLSFTRFPLKDANRLAKWISAIGRTNWIPTKFSFLCSAHFTKDCFEKRQEDQHQLLKSCAVPSIFHFVERQKKVDRIRTSCQGAVKIPLALINEEGALSSRCTTSGPFNGKGLMETDGLPDFNAESIDGNHVHEKSPVVAGSSSSVAGELVDCTNADQVCRLRSKDSQATGDERLLIDSAILFPDDAIPSASGACKLIHTLHSYCLTPPHSIFIKEQVMKKNAELKILRKQTSRAGNRVKRLEELICRLQETNSILVKRFLSQEHGVHIHPAIEPLWWMLGTWISESPGEGSFPSIRPFTYLEKVQITYVGQPMLNFSFNAFDPDTKKPMHRESGFIRIKPGTNKVAFISAQNTGVVEIEEGEVKDRELTLASQSVNRMSFAKEPHVQQITRTFRLTAEGKLEQTVFMATDQQPLTQHLHITYTRSP
uniref:THAP domain containing 4 n=1 Tax=Callorhinchus milii TaxID=7868 RepID=A0A4W3IQI9_CALMI|eukprot:gi/632934472/ref/XP_007884619.1/ PREDICTED: THAP domain-containing protein 4 isoform X1 [Callorhinchus milii]